MSDKSILRYVSTYDRKLKYFAYSIYIYAIKTAVVEIAPLQQWLGRGQWLVLCRA